MSSIHYKFRNALSYSIINISGLEINVNNLKKEICEKENIRIDSFDLGLENPHTNQEYKEGDSIPRNSSVIVKRIPRDGASKLPKLLESNVYGTDGKDATLDADTASFVDYAAMSEIERIAHMKHTSTVAYHASNFQRKTINQTGVPPPPTYVCNRCLQAGHWYKMCPMINTKRTTGIPTEELMESTKDDPNAMLHPSGKYVIPIMHWKARNQKMVESNVMAQAELDIKIEAEMKKNELPYDLTCRLCNGIFRDAVQTMCCGNSFCADCLTKAIFDSPEAKCPGISCHQKKMTSNSFSSNKKLREKVATYSLSLACLNSEQSLSHKNLGPSVKTEDPFIISGVIKSEAEVIEMNNLKKDPDYIHEAPKVIRIDLSNPQAFAMNSNITAETVLDNIHGKKSPIHNELSKDDTESSDDSLELAGEKKSIVKEEVFSPRIVDGASPISIITPGSVALNQMSVAPPGMANIITYPVQQQPFDSNNGFMGNFSLPPPGFMLPPITTSAAGNWGIMEEKDCAEKTDGRTSKKENRRKRSRSKSVDRNTRSEKSERKHRHHDRDEVSKKHRSSRDSDGNEDRTRSSKYRRSSRERERRDRDYKSRRSRSPEESRRSKRHRSRSVEDRHSKRDRKRR
uniref:DWNN domain-containing protein n=1 Tax=Rhabditophanes sp. KR3021 TaxID=114890 RepID=A0AC35U5X0_9BILA